MFNATPFVSHVNWGAGRKPLQGWLGQQNRLASYPEALRSRGRTAVSGTAPFLWKPLKQHELLGQVLSPNKLLLGSSCNLKRVRLGVLVYRPSWALKGSCPHSCGGGCECLVCPPSWALKWSCLTSCGGGCGLMCPPSSCLKWSCLASYGGGCWLVGWLVGWLVCPPSWALKWSCPASCGGGQMLVGVSALRWSCLAWCGGVCW